MYFIPAFRVSLVREGSVRMEQRPQMKTPADAASVFLKAIPDDGTEHFMLITVDIRRRITGSHEISTGCLSSSLVHPREAFTVAILHKAAAVIFGHNHPSGCPEPSAEDMSLTRRLVAAGTMLGIEVLDHVITANGSGRHVSMKERGFL